MPATQKSKRNKTLDISPAEGAAYLERCLRPAAGASLDAAAVLDRTLCGDAFAILPLLPRQLADVAVVDPPYNLSKDYAGQKFSSTSRGNYEEYTRRWLSLVLPVLKPTASLYVCADWKSSIPIANVLADCEARHELRIQNRITWQREKGRGAAANWKNAMEDIWFCTRSSEYTFNLDAVKLRRRVIATYRVGGRPKDWHQDGGLNWRDTCPSNFWDDISVPFWSMAENTAHPAQKPEKLVAKLVLASSRPGDVVLDPFLGSGTTSVTAKKLGRHYVGIEEREQYCVWAEKRLADADSDAGIQGYADGVFWERNSAPRRAGPAGTGAE